MIESLAQLNQVVQSGESETLEFKEGFGEEALESICAFANTSGGDIFIGVSDAGDLKGIMVGKRTLEDWANDIKISLAPKTLPRIRTIPNLTLQNQKSIVVITVDQNLTAVVSYKGKFYRRVGKTNQMMSGAEIAQKLLATTQISWDAVSDSRAKISDLDETAFSRLLVLLKQHNRRPVGSGSLESILEKLGLLDGSNISRAAVLLLGKEPQKFYPTAFIKLGRFRSPTQITDEIELSGNLLDQLERSIEWLRLRLETKFEIKDRSTRKTSWEYPLDAVREAIANAICHRDYNEDGSTLIKLFPNHIEFWNPGSLLAPLQIDDLKKEHRSIQRNRKIAEIFFNCGFVERWGTGTLRMAESLASEHYPPPDFQSTSQNSFKVTFRKEFSADFLKEQGLNQRQRDTLQTLLESGSSIKNLDYQEKFDVAKRTATRELSELVEKGFLERHGSTGKGTFYTLK